MGNVDYARPLVGEERFVETRDGTRLRTVSLGTGDQCVVLAHGFASGADAWNLVGPRLVENGLRVIAFDQRGHGRSAIGSAGTGSLAMAADYGAVLEAYDLSGATLVGHSMGGFLSIAFILEGSQEQVGRVGSLLLMGTFAGDVSRDNPQNKLQIPLIKAGILQRVVKFGPVASAFTKTLIGDDFDAAMVDPFIDTFLKADHANLIPILQAMVDESRYGRLGEIALPTTVLVGERDKTTPPFHTADLHAGLSGSKLVRLPGVGHGLNWEAPDVVVEEIVALANKVASA